MGKRKATSRTAPAVKTLKLSAIEVDSTIQPRVNGLNPDVVAEYAEAMRDGARFPPIVVYEDGAGSCWLSEGFHRVAAAVEVRRQGIALQGPEGEPR